MFQLTARRAEGVALVELMIGLTLSLLLLGAVLQVFIGSKQAYRTNEALSRVQESGRFAIEFLSYDLRMAGFQGCANLESLQPNVIASPPANWDFASDTVIQGEDDVHDGQVGGRAVRAGTDVITLRFADPADARLTGNMNSDNANVQVNRNAGAWKAGDALFITDCETADIFRATTVSKENGGEKITIAHANNTNTTNRLSKAYGEDARVMAFRAHTYYVAATGRTDAGGNPVLSLYRNEEELVEGINQLQIVYGVDADDDQAADDYLDADAVADWRDVVAARVCAVAASVETGVATETASVSCHGDVTDLDSNRLGQAFTATIALRNRLK